MTVSDQIDRNCASTTIKIITLVKTYYSLAAKCQHYRPFNTDRSFNNDCNTGLLALTVIFSVLSKIIIIQIYYRNPCP